MSLRSTETRGDPIGPQGHQIDPCALLRSAFPASLAGGIKGLCDPFGIPLGGFGSNKPSSSAITVCLSLPGAGEKVRHLLPRGVVISFV